CSSCGNAVSVPRSNASTRSSSILVLYDIVMINDIERAAHLIAVHLDRAGLGVTQAEAHVLAQLDRAGPSSVGELHREFGHEGSRPTRVLAGLGERGYVERTVTPDDRRSFVVTPTREGAQVAKRVVRTLDVLERAIAGKRSPAAIADALARLL